MPRSTAARLLRHPDALPDDLAFGQKIEKPLCDQLLALRRPVAPDRLSRIELSAVERCKRDSLRLEMPNEAAIEGLNTDEEVGSLRFHEFPHGVDEPFVRIRQVAYRMRDLQIDRVREP